MKSGKNEFLGLLCKLYIAALLVALPLYIGEGYWNMGNTKYMLFRNMSFLCLGLWLGAEILGGIGAAAGRLRRGREGTAGRRQGLSLPDLAVAAYIIVTVLSALLSDYGKLAWDGYEGWFMGAVSQLLLAGIYFFVSRRYDGARWPLYLGEIAVVLVTLFGLLHRLGIDPLGLLVYWNSGDWEYSHMLSTLGNINWLCGYYSVATAFLTVHFLRAKALWLKALLYAGTVAVFVLLGVQGSQGGWLILAVCAACGLFLGRKSFGVRRRLYGLYAGFFFCMPLMWLGMTLRGEKAAVVRDGNVFEAVEWYQWLIAGAVCLASCLLCGRWKIPKGRRRLVKTVFLAGGAVCGAVAVFVVLGRGIDDSFGSGRGFLWRIALESFRAADGKDMLLGAGPDCYAEAVFNRLGAGSDVWKGEHWETAVFTNAHNEILNQLCNIGILGTMSYLAIFLTGLYQCRPGSEKPGGSHGGTGKAGTGPGLSRTERQSPGNTDDYILWVGFMAIAMYGAHALISFQQVLNAPFFFLVLGLCGSVGRPPGAGPRQYEYALEHGERIGEDNEVEEI
nr:O-antigen ligase family protein [uncultured Acetatifactor sp.]